MKRILFCSLLLTLLMVVGCTTFVTREFLTCREPMVLDNVGECPSDTLLKLKGWDVAAQVVSVRRSRDKTLNNAHLYSLVISPHKRNWDGVDRTDLVVDSVVVRFLPQSQKVVLRFDPVSTRGARSQGLNAVDFETFHIPPEIDSINLQYHVRMITADSVTIAESDFDYNMYRFEDKYKLSSIGLWMLND